MGDPELWILYPFELPEPLPEGEVFRRELIITHFARTKEDGERLIQRTLAQVQAIVGLQTELVDHYNAMLVQHAASFAGQYGRGMKKQTRVQ